ncbi:MAG TPA: glycosyltransferase [Dehalococcoidia bacterium]|nr:glycosyltransferase [Dehalococcoidia bacterium]
MRLKSKPRLEDYEPIVSKSCIEELRALARKLSGKVVQIINSTFIGGGVSEILGHMVPLFNQLGVDARWDVIRGDETFFEVTKKFHNALHGEKEKISPQDFALFREVTKQHLEELSFYGDIFFIQDPQPVGLVAKKKEVGRNWVWRCHIDISKPDKRVWNFIRQFVLDYDAAVFSAPNFAQRLPVRQFMITPSIDPLSDKNREIDQNTVDSVLTKYGLTSNKPMVVQISRFDRLKDPLGVLEAFEIVKKAVDCQLVLAGGTAADDPESEEVLEEVRRRANGNRDIHVLLVPPESDLEINALQRAATVIIQKSLKEGFGLTISEALWKGKPVVASAVGGIPLQVKNALTGLLCYSVEGAAYHLKRLLTNPEYASWLGQNGKEHVRQNFLVTNQIKDLLLMFLAIGLPGKSSDVVHL